MWRVRDDNSNTSHNWLLVLLRRTSNKGVDTMKRFKASEAFIGLKVIAFDGFTQSVGIVVDYVPGDYIVGAHNLVKFDSEKADTVFSYSDVGIGYQLLVH